MIESSHSKRRLAVPRLRDVTAPARSAPGRQGRATVGETHKRARRLLDAPLRARVASGVTSALGGEASPQTGAQLARDALTLYRAARRELRTDSPLALSHLVRWAIGTAVAQYLALAASDAGPSTDRGRGLLELALRLEGRAERASIAALTMAHVLGGKRPSDAPPPPWLEPAGSNDTDND